MSNAAAQNAASTESVVFNGSFVAKVSAESHGVDLLDRRSSAVYMPNLEVQTDVEFDKVHSSLSLHLQDRMNRRRCDDGTAAAFPVTCTGAKSPKCRPLLWKRTKRFVVRRLLFCCGRDDGTLPRSSSGNMAALQTDSAAVDEFDIGLPSSSATLQKPTSMEHPRPADDDDDDDLTLKTAVSLHFDPYDGRAKIDVLQFRFDLAYPRLTWRTTVSMPNIAVQTASGGDDSFDIGLSSACTQEPILMDSPRPAADDLMLPKVAVPVKPPRCCSAPLKRRCVSLPNLVVRMDCAEFDRAHGILPQKPMIRPRCHGEAGQVTTGAKPPSQLRSLWKRVKCLGLRLFCCT